MKFIILVAVIVFLPSFVLSNGYSSQVQHEWSFVNFSFPTASQYDEYMSKEVYKQALLAGVVYSKSGRMFISVPRWFVDLQNKAWVPGTLNEVLDQGNELNPILTPYPSFQLNSVILPGQKNNDNSLQSVCGFIIDEDDILWALDMANVGGNYIPGAIKLVLIDLKNDSIIQTISIPESIAWSVSGLNDLVVDKENGFVYITDPGSNVGAGEKLQGALIVVNLKTNPISFKRWFNGWNITNNDPNFWLEINNEKVYGSSPVEMGADGIALSPDKKILMFCALSSNEIFTVPSKYLQNFTLTDYQVYEKVQKFGSRNFASDGIIFDKYGNLFLTDLQHSGIVKLSNSFSFDLWDSAAEIITQNSSITFPNNIWFLNDVDFVYMANQFQHFANGDFNFDDHQQIKFRVVRTVYLSSELIQFCYFICFLYLLLILL